MKNYLEEDKVYVMNLCSIFDEDYVINPIKNACFRTLNGVFFKKNPFKLEGTILVTKGDKKKYVKEFLTKKEIPANFLEVSKYHEGYGSGYASYLKGDYKNLYFAFATIDENTKSSVFALREANNYDIEMYGRKERKEYMEAKLKELEKKELLIKEKVLNTRKNELSIIKKLELYKEGMKK